MSLDFYVKIFLQDFQNSNKIVIFTYNLKTKQMEKPKEKQVKKPKCQHIQTYIAVRHLSGIQLVKCSDCGQTL